MGLVVLAAGTSIPDTLSSVMVAKRGLGDMVRDEKQMQNGVECVKCVLLEAKCANGIYSCCYLLAG